MIYCIECVMPSSRPGLSFDDSGLCSACRAYKNRRLVDYDKRWNQLEQLCDQYRGMNGPSSYDCMIAVSGGKDSHYQTYIMKKVLGMNPLLVSVEDNFKPTNAGIHNIKNISEAFSCDVISLKPNLKAQKVISRYCFERYGKPTYMIDRYIYSYPLHMASKFNTPLLVYGENISYEYGGKDSVETYSAKEQINNGVGSGIPIEELLQTGVSVMEMNFMRPPSSGVIEKLDPIYLSYFVSWNSFKNYEIAKRYGFHDLTHEWVRTHHVEQMDQIDSAAYLVHSWMKYPKYGHASATDYCSRMIRYGMITREEAKELVKKHDHALDPRSLREFCDFFGYSETEFWGIIDSHYNTEIFEKDPTTTRWVLRDNSFTAPPIIDN